MATLTYREAVARGVAQEMARDERVILIGEDVAEAGGVTNPGLYQHFDSKRELYRALLDEVHAAIASGPRKMAAISRNWMRPLPFGVSFIS